MKITKFFLKFKKPNLWPIFGSFPNFSGKNFFSQNICPCHAKFQRKLTIQFQENTWTNGRTDRPYFIGAFGYCQESNKYNCCKPAFKSQRYSVRCWSNKKLLYHNQHAKMNDPYTETSMMISHDHHSLIVPKPT